MLETNTAFRAVIANNDELTVLTDEDFAKIKEVLLVIMDDIDATCKKHGLTYVLCGGSCLGAIRHHGFIPWDDDMDIAMPRSDYDKLAECLAEDYPKKYWVQSIMSNPKTENSSMKVRMAGTKCVELFEPDMDTAGVFIDVYSLEDTYNSRVLRRLHGYRGMFYLLVCSCVRMVRLKELIWPYLSDRKMRRTVRIKYHMGKLFSYRSLYKWLMKTERVLAKCKNENSEFVSIPSGRKHYFGEMYRRSSCFPPQKVSFEGHTYYTMNNPDEYLTKMYGNYMEIPVEKPERHAILELEIK